MKIMKELLSFGAGKGMTFGERLDYAGKFFDYVLYSGIASLVFGVAGTIALAIAATAIPTIVLFILFGVCLILMLIMAEIGIRLEFGRDKYWDELERKAKELYKKGGK